MNLKILISKTVAAFLVCCFLIIIFASYSDSLFSINQKFSEEISSEISESDSNQEDQSADLLITFSQQNFLFLKNPNFSISFFENFFFKRVGEIEYSPPESRLV
jgi:hypothetical protein